MSRSSRLWCAIGIAAWIISTSFHADAFEVVRKQNGNVIVWDNDYLDRRFGRTWRPGESTSESPRPAGPEIISVPEPRWNEVQPNHSLLTGISRTTTARRAAALRIAETGRRALQQKQYRRAVYYLEKALSLDANPLIYFYLALALPLGRLSGLDGISQSCGIAFLRRSGMVIRDYRVKIGTIRPP